MVFDDQSLWTGKVATAANLPEELAYRGLEDDDGAKLVIVNLQETPLE